jgi:RNA polymerase sigma factor (sigma-70 family)
MTRRPGPAFDPDEDARLVERCLGGDSRAWESLVARHERLVYAVARSYRLDDADVADVFQDVFAALVRGLPRLRDARTLVRWLASTTERIARTTALARRREEARSRTEPAALEALAADDPDVGQELEVLEAQALMRLALASLPEGCRQLLAALYYDDPAPDYAAISRRLGMPVGSIGPTRARCIDKLRRKLEALAGPGAGIMRAPAPTSEATGPTPGPGSREEERPGRTEKRG